VEAAFGLADKAITNWIDSTALMNAAISFQHSRANGELVLSYPAQGISFVLKSNFVTSFQVFIPVKATTALPPAVTSTPGNLP
jgi:hypothetical protein